MRRVTTTTSRSRTTESSISEIQLVVSSLLLLSSFFTPSLAAWSCLSESCKCLRLFLLIREVWTYLIGALLLILLLGVGSIGDVDLLLGNGLLSLGELGRLG